MGKIIIPIEKRETEETAVEEEKTLLDIAEEPTIKLAPAVPGAPNNMIQKHVDNFLAKIAGETPVDDKPRDSTEYWLNKIAESGGGGTTVVANPTLAGTEETLTGLQVGNTKYRVGGIKKYLHRYSYATTNVTLLFDVISEKSTRMTDTELRTLLINQGYTQDNHLLMAVGSAKAWDSSIIEGPICGIRADVTYGSFFLYVYNNGSVVYANTSVGSLPEAQVTIIPLN